MDEQTWRRMAAQILMSGQPADVSFGPPVGMPQQPFQPMPQQSMPQMPAAPVPFETPESVLGKMFQGVDPLSTQADAIRERAMQQYRMGR